VSDLFGRKVLRATSAIGLVVAGLFLASAASSQQRPPPKPAGKGSASAGKGPAAAPTFADIPPPTFGSSVPAGAYSITNLKGPGVPVVIATKPWPARVMSSASAAPAASAAPTVAAKTSNLPPVSGEQDAALRDLTKEADRYRKGAAGYAQALNQIIRQRFEAKKKSRLGPLAENIRRDEDDIVKARQDTIKRLKAFIGKYPDDPDHTPDAMFRLAALFQEEAEETLDPTSDDYPTKLLAAMEPAERLYRDVIVKFPGYRNLGAVHFFLGSLLADTGRAEESQWVWRAMVCSNHYSYPLPAPKDAAEEKDRKKWKDGIPPLPQDHDYKYWGNGDPPFGWRLRHDPDLLKAKAKTRTPAGPKKGVVDLTDDEDSYKDPYPTDCTALGGKVTETGEEQSYIAQTWWRMGEYHYGHGDENSEATGYFGASPYQYNRSESAYRHALDTSSQTVQVYTIYKLAWTYFKQQRYTTSRKEFLMLLDWFDQHEKAGDTEIGTDVRAQMRQDAYDYIASSLTYLDMDGPGAGEPYVQREDVFDVAQGEELEGKLRIALDRVQKEEIVPQGRVWTPRVYKALAAEFESDEVMLDAIEAYELIIKKWPCDPEAPKFQDSIAKLYEQQARKTLDQSKKKEFESKALAARTKLVDYVGKTTWTECNKNNPDAIRAAEALMNEGAKNAAGQHTQNGRNYLTEAKAAAGVDPRMGLERDAILKLPPDKQLKVINALQKARDEYELASKGWETYLGVDPDASDAYDSKYFISDARVNLVLVDRLLGRPIDPKAVEAARSASVEVRDSNLDDKYLFYAAINAVDVVEQLEKEQFDLYMKSGCQTGVGNEKVIGPITEPRDACRSSDDIENREEERLWIREVPDAVVRAMREREEYIARVPKALDQGNRAGAYESQNADVLYRYGRFDEATERYEKLRTDHCGKDDEGFNAWYRLVIMSKKQGDAKRLLSLVADARKKSCATNAEQKEQEKAIAEPAEIGALYAQADEAYEAAKKETDPKLRKEKFESAAAKYELALKTAPKRPEAPRGAILAADCYKQVNDYKKAADVYRYFLDKYGKESDLIAYRDGGVIDGKPVKKNPEEFERRNKYTNEALAELGRTYVQAFDYSSAAKHYDEMASRTLIPEGDRRDNAANAVVLQANLGNRKEMLDAYTRYLSLKPGPAEIAEMDWVIAEFEWNQWKQAKSDTAQRTRATGALEGFYRKYENNTGARAYAIEAAWQVATIRKEAGDQGFRDWYKKTMATFKVQHDATKKADGSSATDGSQLADFGAEADYFFINEQIEKEWDQAGISYNGSADDVMKKVDKDVEKREKFFVELERVRALYNSRRYLPVILAREGTLYDQHRQALVKGKVQAIDPAKEKQIVDLEEKCRKILEDDSSSEKAKETCQTNLDKMDVVRKTLAKKWLDAREGYVHDMELRLTQRYAAGYLRGKKFGVKDAIVVKAVQRLAYYTDLLTDLKLREYLTPKAGTPELKEWQSAYPEPFNYVDQMFKQARPGAQSSPAPTVDTPIPPGPTAPAPKGG
jgi:tetratricopeptide (TPR) repeat protein